MTAPIDQKTQDIATAEAAVTAFLELTFREQQYALQRLKVLTPNAFGGGASGLPDGATSLAPPYFPA